MMMCSMRFENMTPRAQKKWLMSLESPDKAQIIAFDVYWMRVMSRRRRSEILWSGRLYESKRVTDNGEREGRQCRPRSRVKG